MTTKMALDALTAALSAMGSCEDGDYSTGYVCHPHFDGDAIDAAIEQTRAAIAALQAEPTDTSILVRLHRPEGYEDVHPELVLEDANINPAFLPELATPPKD